MTAQSINGHLGGEGEAKDPLDQVRLLASPTAHIQVDVFMFDFIPNMSR